MSKTININCDVVIDGGPTFQVGPNTFQVDAYDMLHFTVENDNADKKVEIQPAAQRDKIYFLSVISDQYDQTSTDATKKLFYKIGDITGPAANAKEMKLDRPHVFIGSAMVEMLYASPQTLTFKNATDKRANIEITVARKA